MDLKRKKLNKGKIKYVFSIFVRVNPPCILYVYKLKFEKIDDF